MVCAMALMAVSRWPSGSGPEDTVGVVWYQGSAKLTVRIELSMHMWIMCIQAEV